MTTYFVGRQPDPTQTRVVIAGEPTVSSSHCRITALGGGEYSIEDSDSTNGTYVRDPGGWRRVAHARVGGNDEIRLGKFLTTVSDLISKAVVVQGKKKVSRDPRTGKIIETNGE